MRMTIYFIRSCLAFSNYLWQIKSVYSSLLLTCGYLIMDGNGYYKIVNWNVTITRENMMTWTYNISCVEWYVLQYAVLNDKVNIHICVYAYCADRHLRLTRLYACFYNSIHLISLKVIVYFCTNVWTRRDKAVVMSVCFTKVIIRTYFWVI